MVLIDNSRLHASLLWYSPFSQPDNQLPIYSVSVLCHALSWTKQDSPVFIAVFRVPNCRFCPQLSVGRDAAAACPNDSFSIAVAMILFPLMIEVVQMTIFLRAG